MGKWLQDVWKWIVDNKDWLFGSGVALAVLGGIYKLIAWLVKAGRTRKTRTDTSPFKIVPPNSNVAKEVLGGADDDPLADRNIPYQQRIGGRNTRREIEELLEERRWVLITGRTGLGKTREAVLVAESLNKEGWTVLSLTREQWLDAPARLPNGIPERKLLFLLDDLNRKMYAGGVEQSPKAGELLQPLTEPLQKRLQRTLEAYEKLCGKEEILVIATVRDERVKEFPDEPSQWEKLEFNKYPDLWQRFVRYELLQPEDAASESLLAQTVPQTKIQADPKDFASFAQHNDCTFANLVENLRTARNTGQPLNQENFRETLKGTWEERYRAALAKRPAAHFIYAAIALLRNAGVDFSSTIVEPAARLLADGNLFQRILHWQRIRASLRFLVQKENILQPRDGQIEAAGPAPALQPCLLSLSRLFIRLSKGDSNATEGLLGLGVSLYEDGQKEAAMEAWEMYEQHHPEDPGVQNNLGIVYRALGRTDEALAAYQKAIELDPKFAYPWNGLGNVYADLDRADEAIAAYQKAIELDPKFDAPHTGLAGIYHAVVEYEKSIVEYKSAIGLDKDDKSRTIDFNGLGSVYAKQGKPDEAIAAFQKAIKLDPKRATANISLAGCYRKLGREADAAKQVEITRPLMEKESEYNRACFASICGDTEEALHLLKIALEKKQTSLAWARRDPDFDFIRDDPHFKELVGEG